MADQWYYTEQKHRKGPVSEGQLKQLASSGQLKPTEMVWKKGMAQWIRASQVKGLFPHGPPDEPPPIPADDALALGALPPPLPLGFFAYCFQHFCQTHWPAAFGICCGILAVPAVSLLKPLLGFRGLCFVLAGAAALSIVSGILYSLGRFIAYWVGGQRAVPKRCRSLMAVMAYGGLMFLIPMAPWVAGEYFTPPHGLLATIVPQFRKEQEKWLRLPMVSEGSVNLLEKIDPARDTIQGDWSSEGTTLVSANAHPSPILTIPYSPPEEYTLTVVVERKEGNGPFGVGLVVGSTACLVRIDDSKGISGISFVDGQDAGENETKYEHQRLLLRTLHAIEYTVRKPSQIHANVMVKVDGKKIIDWTGLPSRLSLLGPKGPHAVVKAGTDHFLWLENDESSFAVRKLELRPIGKVAEQTADGMVLFDGKTLNGWHLKDPNGPNCWSVENGELTCKALGKGLDLVSDQVFRDFELHLEFILGPGANSGVYLRGLYEVQLVDAHPLNAKGCGAICNNIAPSVDAYLGSGHWNTLNVKLLGQFVTVTMNGKCVIDHAYISGPTDDKYTLPVKEGDPGPIMLQCWENEFRFRNISIKRIGDQAQGRAEHDPSVFVGQWDCASQGRSDVITLYLDFTAHKDRPNPLGKWDVVNGEAHIAWDDGVRTVLRRDGEGFQKLSWKAGASPDSPPWAAWTTPAVKVRGQTQGQAENDPRVFVGQWKCGKHSMTLYADFTARGRTDKANLLGKWECVNGEAHILWDQGAQTVLRRDGEGFQKLTWQAGASLDSPTSNICPAMKQEMVPPTPTPQPTSKWRMTGEYPLIAGKWCESEKQGIFVLVQQNDNKFVANCTYTHRKGMEVHWRAEGTISKDGEITAHLVHIIPKDFKTQTRTGKLDSDGRTIRGRSIFDGGQHDFTWDLKEPYEPGSLAEPENVTREQVAEVTKRKAEGAIVSAPLAFGATPFDGCYYKYVQGNVTWHEAKRRCEEMGGNLVIIENPRQQEFIANFLGHDAVYVLIGLSDEEHENDYRWVDGSQVHFTNWAEGEPNHLGGIEHYGAINPAAGGLWLDIADKHEAIAGFICQWDVRRDNRANRSGQAIPR